MDISSGFSHRVMLGFHASRHVTVVIQLMKSPLVEWHFTLSSDKNDVIRGEGERGQRNVRAPQGETGLILVNKFSNKGRDHLHAAGGVWIPSRRLHFHRDLAACNETYGEKPWDEN